MSEFNMTQLDRDIDTLRDVYMTNSQREALARVQALASDHARLQADAERIDWLEDFVRRAYVYGASFDWAKSCEGEPGGFRFRTRRRLAARQPTLRAAIDATVAVQP